MIGVRCLESEKPVVREFFELFKTPWEFYVYPHHYDVVISSIDTISSSEFNARLVIIFSAVSISNDSRKDSREAKLVSEEIVINGKCRLPVYKEISAVKGDGRPLLETAYSHETIALEISTPSQTIIRVGFNLFQEVGFLLSCGQPVENAGIPALEIHIELLRNWILAAGITLIEVPPVPWGYRMSACITHDVDFIGIRQHKLDRTFWGFIYRAVFLSPIEVIQGRSTVKRLIKNWIAVLSLPLVYLGIIKDFWDEFDTYAQIDREHPSTFFVIPFKNYPGESPDGVVKAGRAVRYDIEDICRPVEHLKSLGFEIGLHGLDAWHSVENGRREFNRIIEATGQKNIGVRMHWLYYDENSPSILEQAGFDYDSTGGYNETIGFRNGTTQVFCPPGASTLLELPLHIQDTALFYPRRLGLDKIQAWQLSQKLIENVLNYGGVLTLLWHVRSLSPERYWGDFYLKLLQELSSYGAWFGTANQLVGWFRQRRSLQFVGSSIHHDKLCLQLRSGGPNSNPPLMIRVHYPRRTQSNQCTAEAVHLDVPLSGESYLEIPFV